MAFGLLPPVPVAIAGGVAAALILSLGTVIVLQHDALVTWRLKDKDQQAIQAQLRRDVSDRDARIHRNANREAGDAGMTAQACAANISTAYQRGVSFGRAISHASPSSLPVAVGGQPAAGVMRDYRAAWEREAFKPGDR